MGLRPLGDKWKRRISSEVGMTVIHASGGGGNEFFFTTDDHRHGIFNRYNLYQRRKGVEVPDDLIFRIYIDSTGKTGSECEAGFVSCRMLFPEKGSNDVPEGN